MILKVRNWLTGKLKQKMDVKNDKEIRNKKVKQKDFVLVVQL